MITFPKHEAYQDSGISWLNEVPSHWKVQLGRGYLKSKKVKNSGNKVKTVLSLSYGKIIVKPEEKLYGLVPESFETYQIVAPGDIIIRATDLQNDQTSLRIGLVEDYGIITSAYLCLQPSEEIDSRFAYYLLHAYDLLKVYYGMGSGLRQNLDYTDFKYLPLTIPDIGEQIRIAEFLDRKTAEIDEAIAQKQRLIELLREQKATLINQAVNKGLNPNVPMSGSGVEWIGNIPDDWIVARFKHITSLLRDGTHLPPPRTRDGFRLLSVRNIIDSEFIFRDDDSLISETHFKDLCKSFQPQKGDVILAIVGATLGKVAVVHELEPFQIQRSLAILRPNERVSSDYLKLWIQSSGIQNLFWNTTEFSAQPGIYLNDLKEFPIVLPPMHTQDEIVLRLTEQFRDIHNANKNAHTEIKMLSELKQVFISEAVTGKIKV